MAKKKAAKKEVEIVSEEVINGAKIITYEDGSVDVIPAPIHFTAEEWANLHDSDEDEEDLTPEQLAGMDFEELEDLCDDKDLDTDPDDYDEDDIDKFRKAVAKELGITLPAAKKSGKKGKK